MATRLAPERATHDAAAGAARALRPEPKPGERRHLRVVPPNYVSARTRQKRARLLVVLAGAGIAAALFGVVAFHVVLTQNQLELQHLRTESDAASVKQQQLRLQVAQLESPERVVDDAQKLGMIPPATVHYLSPDGAVPPPPKPAPTPAPSTARTTAPKPKTSNAYASQPTATTTPAARSASTIRTASPKPTLSTKPTVTTTPSRSTR